MSTLTALVLVTGLLAYAVLDHLLRIRRTSRFDVPEPRSHDTPPEPYESERRMSMSKQQLQTLGLSHVRRAVAAGKAKPSDIERWKGELGADVVQKIVDDAKGAPAPAPVPREQKKTAQAATSAQE